MNTFNRHWLGAATALGLVSSVTLVASAQEAGSNVATSPPAQTPVAMAGTGAPPEVSSTASSSVSQEPVIDAETKRTTFPNRPLLVTGLVVLGGSYGASAIVGAVSNREADQKLYYPVAGPWLDLNDRGCDVDPCKRKTLNNALLIGDGIAQGVGALSVLLSIVIPETTTRSWYLIGNHDLVVAPQVGSNTGLIATGHF